MRTVPVNLSQRSYSIRVGAGGLAELGKTCRKLLLGDRCVVITDSRVGKWYAEKTMAELEKHGFKPSLVTVPSGEKSKSLSLVGRCYDALARHRLERKSFVVALGGGVVGDLAGFVAASYLRGIALIQVPTTLLSQVDSSVGGKVGINLPAGKNLVGAFHQPRAVICDLDTLITLPEREYRSGLAEVIKYGIIYDAALFRRLERDLDRLLSREVSVLESVIARCCAIKADVVSQDETETGLRAILNYGHTLGHAIENVSGYGKYLHGEAISIGQVAASELSVELTGLARRDADRIRKLFLAAGLPVTAKFSPRDIEKLFGAMRLDKKVSDGQVRFVLARSLGKVVWGQSVREDSIRRVIQP